MRLFKKFRGKSILCYLTGQSYDGLDHLEDYLLKDIGMERIGGRVQPVGNELDPENLALKPGKAEDPPV